MRRPPQLLALLAAAVLLAGCTTDEPDPPPDDGGPAGEEPTDDDGSEAGEDAVDDDASGAGGGELAMEGFAFVPTQLEIAAGSALTLTNADSATHTVTAVDGTFDVTVDGGATDELTVDEPGTYDFACSFHPSMTGTLTVG
jgi:plastocyanin